MKLKNRAHEMCIFEVRSNPAEIVLIYQFTALTCEDHLSVPYMKLHFKYVH